MLRGTITKKRIKRWKIEVVRLKSATFLGDLGNST